MDTILLRKSCYQTSHIQNSVSFGAGIPKIKKKEIGKLVDDFVKTSKIPKSRFVRIKNRVGRVCHPVAGGGLIAFSFAALSKGDTKEALLLLGVGLYNLGYEKLFHNIGIQKARRLSQKLCQKGFSEPERIYAVKKYLMKEGGFVYSKVFSLFSAENVKKLANSEKIGQAKGWISSLYSRYSSPRIATARHRLKLAQMNKKPPCITS